MLSCAATSSSAAARAGPRRHNDDVLHEMIAHMQTTPGVIYGLTVDG